MIAGVARSPTKKTVSTIRAIKGCFIPALPNQGELETVLARHSEYDKSPNPADDDGRPIHLQACPAPYRRQSGMIWKREYRLRVSGVIVAVFDPSIAGNYIVADPSRLRRRLRLEPQRHLVTGIHDHVSVINAIAAARAPLHIECSSLQDRARVAALRSSGCSPVFRAKKDWPAGSPSSPGNGYRPTQARVA